MADLATAYLRLIPSLKGAQKQIESELGGINTKSTGGKLGGGLGEGIKGGLGKIAIGNFLGNALSQGVDMAVNATVGTLQNAFENIGSFEQLSGGVEKIFDQANTEQIFADAQNAYKDLNMSANEYLDSINQVGATFAQTMGDQKGYDTARQGMKAIADYASGTGRNLDELNDKYKLITRSASSYQSIADQFAGILPQTSKDFLAAAQNAGLLSTSYTELTQVPVAEYQEAVTKMLEQGVDKLGLLGNTAAESTGTLTGSIAMLQSSWQNLLTELGKSDGDIGARVQEVVDSIGAVASNVIPVLGNVMNGIGQAVQAFIPQLAEYIHNNKEAIANGAVDMLTGLIDAVGVILPPLVAALGELAAQIVVTLVQRAPDILAAAVNLIGAMIEGVVQEQGHVYEAIGQIGQIVLESIGGFFNGLYVAGQNIITSLINGILSGLGPLGDALKGVGDFIVSHKGPPSYDAVMLKPNAELIMGGLTDTIIAEIPALNRAMQMVNGAITLNPAISATSTQIAAPVAAGPNIYVTVEARDGEDYYEVGRRVGQATAYELRMQGVSA